jgi:phage/plasmid-associated DNA primase
MIDGSGEGKGDNGKTFLFNIFKAVMGDYVGKPTSALLEKNNAKVHKQITGLKGKRFIFMEEFPQKAINCDLMKELGDGGEMNNEVMFGTMEKINIIGMFFALSNHTPKLDADESAGYNRYKEVSFKSHFDRTGDREEENEEELEFIADTGIGAKIVDEYRDEVIGLILQYAMRFYTSGIPPTPIEFLQAEQKTKASNDDFLEWFEDNCEKGDEFDKLAEKMIVEMSGIKADKVRKGMARLGYKYKKDLSGGRGYKGGYQGVRFVEEMTSGEMSGSL